MSKISVIVPVYNVEKYLEKCLNSIKNQNFFDYEVIIVNDGSTDNSEIIAAKFVKMYPEKFKLITQKNGGLGAARNTGIENASGEYYLFVDSDDSIISGALEHLYDKAMKNNADMVIFDYKLVYEDGSKEEICSGCKNSSGAMNLEGSPSLLLISPSAWNKFFKSTLFNTKGIRFPTKVWYEDLSTIPKLYVEAEVIVYSSTPLYNYLQREGSIMHSKEIEKNEEIVKALDDLIEYFRINDLFNRYKEELEFLAVSHILLMGSIRVNKLKYNHPLMKLFYNYILRNFPEYKRNIYVKEMTKKEIFILELLSKKRYLLLNLILKIKNLLS